MKHNNTSGGGGFVSMLTIVFIALKLIGVIAWSWWWVLSPLWISALLGLTVWIGLLILFSVRTTLLRGLYRDD